MTSQGHIFISYKSEEREFVERLANSLKSEGIEIWLDKEGLRVGDVWTEEIDQALKSSIAFILVITPDYFDSDWCKEEMEIAHKKRLPIFPVLLRQTENTRIPEWLSLIQRIDFRETFNNESEYSKQTLNLIHQIKKRGLTDSASPVDNSIDGLLEKIEGETESIGRVLERYIKEIWENNVISSSSKWVTTEQMVNVLGELALKMMDSRDGSGLPLEVAIEFISRRLPRRYKLLSNGKKAIKDFLDQTINMKLIKMDKVEVQYGFESTRLVDGVRFFHPLYLAYFMAVGLQEHGLEYLLISKRYNKFDKRVNADWEDAVIALAGIVESPDALINKLLDLDVIVSAKCVLSNIKVSQDTSSRVHAALENKLFNSISERERDFIPEILRFLIEFEGILTLPKIFTVWGNLHRHHRDRVFDMIVGFGRDAVPALLSALKPEYSDKPIYIWIVKALGEIGDKRGLTPLQQLLKPIDEENQLLQMAICASLAKLGENDPIEILRKEAVGTPPPYNDRDRNSTRQINAWYALSDIGIKTFPMMVEIFREVLKPKENSTVWGQASNISLCFSRTMTQRFRNTAVDNLLSELSNPKNPAEFRRTIIDSLAEIQDEKAVPYLAEALHDSEFLVRNSAIEALSKFRTPKVIETLIGALMDPDSFIRGEAAETLGKLKAAQAIPALAKLLDDNELKHDYGERICTIAVSALMAIDTRESLDIAAEWCVKHMNDPRSYHYEYKTVGAWARQRLEFIEPVYTNELIKRFQQND